MRALSIGATGMSAQQTNVEVISNNIANMNTTSYTKRRAEFQDLMYQNLRRVGSQSSEDGTIVPAGIQLGLGVRTAAVYRLLQQGEMVNTGNTFDMAIEGRGYFQIELPGGRDTAYTRDGSFQLSDAGQIVTHDGYTVLPGVTIPQDALDVTINKQGEVWVKLDGQTALSNVGQLQIATFANEAGLEAIGGNMFLETPASGGVNIAAPGAIGYGTISQRFLEGSNVNVVSEITELVRAQRAYEMNSKVIQTADQMMSTLTNLR